MPQSTTGERHFDAILALGSNLGDKVANIERAIALLTESGDIRLVRRSRDYRTAPWGMADQDWFVNACIAVATGLAPQALLQRSQAVEQRMGRVRGEKWGPRIIDIDVLVYRDVVSCDPQLMLPHPGISERAFVLVPLADVAPDLEIDGMRVVEHLARADGSGVVPMDAQ
jgi:2-amino-4-hydroxy-6-hydroxymethyldihydropteridine diphosphokinase